MPSMTDNDVRVITPEGQWTSNDRPGTFQDKLLCQLNRHTEYGVGFDEEKIYLAAGLKPPENPRKFEPNKDISNRDRADERAYAIELRAAGVQAKIAEQEQKEQNASLAALAEENRLLREQVNKILATMGDEPAETAVAIPPVAIPAAVPAPVFEALDGSPLPDPTWGRDRVNRWLEHHGYALPPRKGVGMSGIKLADYAIGKHREAGQVKEQE